MATKGEVGIEKVVSKMSYSKNPKGFTFSSSIELVVIALKELYGLFWWRGWPGLIVWPCSFPDSVGRGGLCQNYQLYSRKIPQSIRTDVLTLLHPEAGPTIGPSTSAEMWSPCKSTAHQVIWPQGDNGNDPQLLDHCVSGQLKHHIQSIPCQLRSPGNNLRQTQWWPQSWAVLSWVP